MSDKTFLNVNRTSLLCKAFLLSTNYTYIIICLSLVTKHLSEREQFQNDLYKSTYDVLLIKYYDGSCTVNTFQSLLHRTVNAYEHI